MNHPENRANSKVLENGRILISLQLQFQLLVTAASGYHVGVPLVGHGGKK